MPTWPKYTEEEMRLVEIEIGEAMHDHGLAQRFDYRIFRLGDEAIGVIPRDGDIMIWRGSPVWRRDVQEAHTLDEFPFQPEDYLQHLRMDRKLLEALMPDFLEMLGPLSSLAAADL